MGVFQVSAKFTVTSTSKSLNWMTNIVKINSIFQQQSNIPSLPLTAGNSQFNTSLQVYRQGPDRGTFHSFLTNWRACSPLAASFCWLKMSYFYISPLQFWRKKLLITYKTQSLILICFTNLQFTAFVETLHSTKFQPKNRNSYYSRCHNLIYCQH